MMKPNRLTIAAFFLWSSILVQAQHTLETLAQSLSELAKNIKETTESISPDLYYKNAGSSIWSKLANKQALTAAEKRQLFIEDCTTHAQLFPLPQKPKICLRIATYNIHQWRDPQNKNSESAIRKAMMKLDADVLCMQEVLLAENRGLYKPNGGPFLDHALINLAGLQNVILSKYPLANVVTKVYESDKSGEQRGYVGGTITFGKHHLRIYCTHLDVWDKTEKSRQVEMTELLKQCDEEKKKDKNLSILICGDFNSIRKQDHQYTVLDDQNNSHTIWDLIHQDKGDPDIPVQQLLSDLLAASSFNCLYDLLPLQRPLFTVWSGKLVDFFYLSKGSTFEPQQVAVYFSAASDHMPVVIDLKIPKENPL